MGITVPKHNHYNTFQTPTQPPTSITMPRNGGDSQNGPIEGQPIVHGNSGDASKVPEHTKNNVAPAPELEKGGAIEGMNASGGGNKADQAEPSVAGQKN